MKATKISALLLSFAIIFTLSTGCGLKNNKGTLTNSATVGNPATNLVKDNKADSTELLSKAFDTSNFKPISSAITQKFYENINRPYDTKIVKGSFDFDGDGLTDNFEVVYTCDKQLNTHSRVSIAGSYQTLNLYGLAGVYAVKLHDNSAENLLAVVEYSTDNYIVTHFFRSRMGKLIDLGSVNGGFARDTNRQFFEDEYNETILIDGLGNLIPRYCLVKFIDPQIVLNILSLEGNRFSRVYYDPNESLAKTYTLTEDISPYFEKSDADVKSFAPNCDDRDIITLAAGTKIKIKEISTKLENLESSLVTIPGDKQGMLYFFLHP